MQSQTVATGAHVDSAENNPWLCPSVETTAMTKESCQCYDLHHVAHANTINS